MITFHDWATKRPQYGPEVQEALVFAWKVCDRRCLLPLDEGIVSSASLVAHRVGLLKDKKKRLDHQFLLSQVALARYT